MSATPLPLLSKDEDTAGHWTSYSGLALHRRCPNAWQFDKVQRLERDESQEAAVERDFGSWWQALRAIDSLNRGRRLGTLKALPESDIATVDNGPTFDVHSSVPEHVHEAADNWWRGVSVEVQAAWSARLGAGLPYLLRNLDTRWRNRWAADLPHEQPMAVELVWRRRLPDLPVGEAPGIRMDPDTMLVGYLDEVYYDTRRGMVVVRDNKANKSLSPASVADDMMDSQLQFYAWGASPTVSSWGWGPIKATAYDRVRSVRPKTPTVTQAGTLSKTVTDYDAWTYLEETRNGIPYPGRKKDGSDAGTYTTEDAVLERLLTPTAQAAWFQRTLTPLNMRLVKAHLRAAVDTALAQQDTLTRVKRDGEAARNLGPSCKWCEFASLCRAQMIGGPDGDYDLAEHRLRRKR